MDLRTRAIQYIDQGGSVLEAARIFGVGRQTLYRWRGALLVVEKQRRATRKRKLDKAELGAHVRDFPDALLRERAAHFGVHINAVWVALRALGVSKKTDEIFPEKSH